MQTKKKPMRQCVGCRESKDKMELIRIVKTPEGDILLDKTGKHNGRGAYICNDKTCLSKARKNGGLNRSLKTEIKQEIYEQIERQMD